MCARRHSSDDDREKPQGLADQLARWDTEQSWMRTSPESGPASEHVEPPELAPARYSVPLEPRLPAPPPVPDSWDAVLSAAEPPPTRSADPWATPPPAALDDPEQELWTPPQDTVYRPVHPPAAGRSGLPERWPSQAGASGITDAPDAGGPSRSSTDSDARAADGESLAPAGPGAASWTTPSDREPPVEDWPDRDGPGAGLLSDTDANDWPSGDPEPASWTVRPDRSEYGSAEPAGATRWSPDTDEGLSGSAAAGDWPPANEPMSGDHRLGSGAGWTASTDAWGPPPASVPAPTGPASWDSDLGSSEPESSDSLSTSSRRSWAPSDADASAERSDEPSWAPSDPASSGRDSWESASSSRDPLSESTSGGRDGWDLSEPAPTSRDSQDLLSESTSGGRDAWDPSESASAGRDAWDPSEPASSGRNSWDSPSEPASSNRDSWDSSSEPVDDAPAPGSKLWGRLSPEPSSGGAAGGTGGELSDDEWLAQLRGAGPDEEPDSRPAWAREPFSVANGPGWSAPDQPAADPAPVAAPVPVAPPPPLSPQWTMGAAGGARPIAPRADEPAPAGHRFGPVLSASRSTFTDLPRAATPVSSPGATDDATRQLRPPAVGRPSPGPGDEATSVLPAPGREGAFGGPPGPFVRSGDWPPARQPSGHRTGEQPLPPGPGGHRSGGHLPPPDLGHRSGEPPAGQFGGPPSGAHPAGPAFGRSELAGQPAQGFGALPASQSAPPGSSGYRSGEQAAQSFGGPRSGAHAAGPGSGGHQSGEHRLPGGGYRSGEQRAQGFGGPQSGVGAPGFGGPRTPASADRFGEQLATGGQAPADRGPGAGGYGSLSGQQTPAGGYGDRSTGALPAVSSGGRTPGERAGVTDSDSGTRQRDAGPGRDDRAETVEPIPGQFILPLPALGADEDPTPSGALAAVDPSSGSNDRSRAGDAEPVGSDDRSRAGDAEPVGSNDWSRAGDAEPVGSDDRSRADDAEPVGSNGWSRWDDNPSAGSDAWSRRDADTSAGPEEWSSAIRSGAGDSDDRSGQRDDTSTAATDWSSPDGAGTAPESGERSPSDGDDTFAGSGGWSRSSAQDASAGSGEWSRSVGDEPVGGSDGWSGTGDDSTTTDEDRWSRPGDGTSSDPWASPGAGDADGLGDTPTGPGDWSSAVTGERPASGAPRPADPAQPPLDRPALAPTGLGPSVLGYRPADPSRPDSGAASQPPAGPGSIPPGVAGRPPAPPYSGAPQYGGPGQSRATSGPGPVGRPGSPGQGVGALPPGQPGGPGASRATPGGPGQPSGRSGNRATSGGPGLPGLPGLPGGAGPGGQSGGPGPGGHRDSDLPGGHGGPPAAPVPGAPAPTVEQLTAQSLLRQRRPTPQTGWRRAVYNISAHTVNPGQSTEDRRRQELIARASVPVPGCYRIAVISLKGGVGKTTTTVTLGATLASLRGDRVIAVDANPDRGTLSGKIPLETVATVRNLLNDVDRIQHYFDVRRYTSQSADRLEVLASESDPAVSTAFSESDYRTVASVLERFYNIVLTDCGTGLLHSAMAGVLDLADQIVLVSSGSVDGARSASATLDWLEAHGRGALVRNSVAVINSVRPKSGGVDLDRLEAHFAARCRAVTRIPYDPHLEEGAEVDLGELSGASRSALLELAAAVADAFPRERRPIE